MKISKRDALCWFEFFASLPEGEELMPRQQEIIYAVYAQIEDALEARWDAQRARIPHLQSLNGRTYFVGDESKFPRGCKSCLFGTGLGAVRKTNRCNAACDFCYDYGVIDQIPPIGEDMWEIGGCKYRERDLPLLLSAQKKPSGVAYVYLEPFMEIEKYYGVIRAFHEAGVYQHLYTNGLAATDDTLRALGENGLNEIRFNLGASNCAPRVIDNMALAKKHIPRVGVETPMTPAMYDAFLKRLPRIAATGLDFVNFAELHLNANNIGNYAGESLYVYRHGYLSPIWSRQLTLDIMRVADEEQWDFVVHDCSNRTKFVRDLALGGRERNFFGASAYASEFDSPPFDALLPILRDDTFPFLVEEELPVGFRPGDIVL